MPAPRYPTALAAATAAAPIRSRSCSRHGDRGRLFDQLLVAALHRAFALAQMDGALVIGEDLDLDVPGPLDVLLEVDAGVAERLERFGRGGFERAIQCRRLAHHAHPLPPPPAAALTSTGNPISPRRLGRLGRIGHRRRSDPARSARRPPPCGGGPRSCLPWPEWRPPTGRRRSGRPRHRLGKGRPARPEIRSPGAPPRRRSRGPRRSVGRCGGSSRTEVADRWNGEIGGADVGAEAVGVGIDRDRLESFLVAGADDSQRDLAPIGDQDPLHRKGAGGSPTAGVARDASPSWVRMLLQRRALRRAAARTPCGFPGPRSVRSAARSRAEARSRSGRRASALPRGPATRTRRIARQAHSHGRRWNRPPA